MRRWTCILRYTVGETYVCRAFPDSRTMQDFAEHIARVWRASILQMEY
jgi:hypothetical protein